jgi:hypothetical protein
MRIGKCVVVGIVATAVAGVTAGSAAAETDTFHETTTFGDYIPCVSDFPSLEGFELTTTVNGVEHFNGNKNGGHFTFTTTGTVSGVPVLFADEDGNGEPDFDEETESYVIAGPREGESFTGRFTIWGGGNFNRSGIQASTFTFSGSATGDQGTAVQWNSVDHITSVGDPFEDPTAIVKSEFSRSNCH